MHIQQICENPRENPESPKQVNEVGKVRLCDFQNHPNGILSAKVPHPLYKNVKEHRFTLGPVPSPWPKDTSLYYGNGRNSIKFSLILIILNCILYRFCLVEKDETLENSIWVPGKPAHRSWTRVKMVDIHDSSKKDEAWPFNLKDTWTVARGFFEYKDRDNVGQKFEVKFAIEQNQA